MIRKTSTIVLALALAVGFAGTAIADTTSAEVAYPWPPADIKPVNETAKQLEQRAARFSAHQSKQVPVVVRGAKDVEPGAWGHEAEGFYDGQQYMNNHTTYTDREGTTSFYTQVHAPGYFTHSPSQVCDGQLGEVTCTGVVRQPDGGLILFTKGRSHPFRVVYSYRPNGEVVWTQANTDSAITSTQLARLAADRAFTFTK